MSSRLYYFFTKNNRKILLGEYFITILTKKEVKQLNYTMLEIAMLDNVSEIYYTENETEYKLDYYNLDDNG